MVVLDWGVRDVRFSEGLAVCVEQVYTIVCELLAGKEAANATNSALLNK